uniref:Uncharacterized protein n=1 Tax=Triticum urartu TaxID=4572 RepID=A0A8R7K1E4_TRIUA
MSSIDASAYLLAGSGVGAGAGVAVSFRPGAGGRSPRSVPNLRNSCARYPASSLLLPPWGGGVGMVGGLLANRDSWCGFVAQQLLSPGRRRRRRREQRLPLLRRRRVLPLLPLPERAAARRVHPRADRHPEGPDCSGRTGSPIAAGEGGKYAEEKGNWFKKLQRKGVVRVRPGPLESKSVLSQGGEREKAPNGTGILVEREGRRGGRALCRMRR